MTNKLTKERIEEVAKRYGFEVEFNSPNPGVEFVRNDGTVKHYSVDEAADFALGQTGTFNGKKARVVKSDKKIHVQNEFSNFPYDSHKEAS